MKTCFCIVSIWFFLMVSGCGNQMEAEYETLEAESQELMLLKGQLERRMDALEEQVQTLMTENEKLDEELNQLLAQQAIDTDNMSAVEIGAVEMRTEEDLEDISEGDFQE